jgi:hypothetical protein
VLPLGAWAGCDGVDGRDNFVGAFRMMKTPILHASGFGAVAHEAELDVLINVVKAEWDATPGAAMDYLVFTARKPLDAEASLLF